MKQAGPVAVTLKCVEPITLPHFLLGTGTCGRVFLASQNCYWDILSNM